MKAMQQAAISSDEPCRAAFACLLASRIIVLASFLWVLVGNGPALVEQPDPVTWALLAQPRSSFLAHNLATNKCQFQNLD